MFVVSQWTPVYTLLYHFLDVDISVALPYVPVSSEWLFSFSCSLDKYFNALLIFSKCCSWSSLAPSFILSSQWCMERRLLGNPTRDDAIAWRTQYDKTQRISFGVHWYNFLFYFACYISSYFSCLFIHAVTINWYSSEHIMPLVHDCHRVWKFVFLIAKYLKCLQLRMEELVDLLSLQAALRRYRCAKWNK